MISDVMLPKITQLVNHFNKLSTDYWSASMSLKSTPNISLKGFCTFIEWESEERWKIAEDISDFMLKNSRPVVIEATPKPKNNFNSPQQIVDYLLGLENTTLSVIWSMIGESVVGKDYNTESYLKWLYKNCLKQQMEVQEVSTSLKMYGGDAAALMMKDTELYKEYSEYLEGSCND